VAFYVTPANRPPPGLTSNRYRIHGSLPHRYALFVWNIVRHGDLGRSYADREPVTARIGRAAPVTLSLVVGGLVVWLLIAVPLGLLAALRPRSLLDVAVIAFVLVGISLHPLWLGLVLGFVLGQHWHLLPTAGYCDLFSPSTACGGPGAVARPSPAAVADVRRAERGALHADDPCFRPGGARKDYVVVARAKGAGTGRVLRAHVGVNVMPPFVAMIGMTVRVALAGVIFVETVSASRARRHAAPVDHAARSSDDGRHRAVRDGGDRRRQLRGRRRLLRARPANAASLAGNGAGVGAGGTRKGGGRREAAPSEGDLRARRAQPVVPWSSVAALFAWSAGASSQFMAQRSQSC
jgi:hypothetical protein